MEVYLIRHGIAVGIGEEGVSRDEARMLSKRGQTRTRQAARGLREVARTPERIFSSPLVRAVETAEIIREEMAPDCTVEHTALLAFEASARKVVTWLGTLAGDPVVLVGHMPNIAELASVLLAGDTVVDIAFKKAAACGIAFSGRPASGEGCLEWLVPPRVLCRVGRKAD